MACLQYNAKRLLSETDSQENVMLTIKQDIRVSFLANSTFAIHDHVHCLRMLHIVPFIEVFSHK